jgi:hypothetical protein
VGYLMMFLVARLNSVEQMDDRRKKNWKVFGKKRSSPN